MANWEFLILISFNSILGWHIWQEPALCYGRLECCLHTLSSTGQFCELVSKYMPHSIHVLFWLLGPSKHRMRTCENILLRVYAIEWISCHLGCGVINMSIETWVVCTSVICMCYLVDLLNQGKSKKAFYFEPPTWWELWSTRSIALPQLHGENISSFSSASMV